MGLTRLYFATYRAYEGLVRLIGTAYAGFWLGILSRKQLYAIGKWKYRLDRRYWTDEWNRQGLTDWERAAFEQYFSGTRKILVAGAGGGREVIALRRLGLEATGFDADPGLVRGGNSLLEREGLVPDLQLAPWDRCPDMDGMYDAAIVGWGAYMLIRGRETRTAFLRQIRARLIDGAPLLLSFYVRAEDAPSFRGVARIGNVLASLLRRERVEIGDRLIPNFAHYFSRAELASELQVAGFVMDCFETAGYAHAVGRAG